MQKENKDNSKTSEIVLKQHPPTKLNKLNLKQVAEMNSSDLSEPILGPRCGGGSQVTRL
jgi:hypothetical protein